MHMHNESKSEQSFEVDLQHPAELHKMLDDHLLAAERVRISVKPIF